MPSNSSGQSKLTRPVYSTGSGGLNLNHSDHDDYVDPVRTLRWGLFQREHKHLEREEVIALFKQKFNYT